MKSRERKGIEPQRHKDTEKTGARSWAEEMNTGRETRARKTTA